MFDLSLKNIDFVNPEAFFLLLIIPILFYWLYRNRFNHFAPITISSLSPLEGMRSWRNFLTPLLPILKTMAGVLFIVALARPQLSLQEEEVKAEGIDIFMVMDLSSSMLAKDFEPNRLEVSKQVAVDFVDKRPYDRIGLAVFAGESFTQCPLTTDHRIVNDFLSTLQCGILEDGTAIGMGLASAVNRIKDGETKSKIIILLTDGVNNSGYVKPLTAAEIANEFNVKVYTIGVGSTGEALTPVSRRSDGQYVFGYSAVEIDEDLLKQISEMTGGKYYRATTSQGLVDIYDEIDQLEKTEMEISTFKRYKDKYVGFLSLGIILLLIEFILRASVLRTIP